MPGNRSYGPILSAQSTLYETLFCFFYLSRQHSFIITHRFQFRLVSSIFYYAVSYIAIAVDPNMASTIIYANQPKDFSLWDAHKDILRQLYLTEKKPLKEVKRLMESQHRFPCNFTLSSYETTLRDHLGFRKNLKHSDYEAISTKLDERQNKESVVTLDGDRLPRKRVDRGIKRHYPKVKRDATPAHVMTPHMRPEIVIRTPSPALPDIVPDVQSFGPVSRGEHTNAINSLIVTSTSEIAQNSLQFPSIYHHRVGFLLQGHFAQARKNLPINEFAGKLIENLRLVQMTGSPTTFGLNTSVEILLHASYMLSNGHTLWDGSLQFITWIEKVADIQLLRQFFSQNTPTTIAAWSRLFQMPDEFPIRLDLSDTVVEIWFRVGILASNGKWIHDNDEMCFHALRRMDPAKRWAVLKYIWQSKKMHGFLSEPSISRLLEGQLWGVINDPSLTKDVINSGIPLPQMAFSSSWLPKALSGIQSQSQCIKMLVDSGVNFVSGTPSDNSILRFWLPKPPVRISEKAWLTQLDDFLGTFDLLNGFLKDCVTVCGICAAAGRGVECLREYVRGKPHQELTEYSPRLPLTKEELLQVALSKTIKMGLQSIVEVLLQFGAEFSVNILRDFKSELRYSRIPHPVLEAVHASDVGMIRLLAKSGADFDHQEVLDAVLDCNTERSEGMGLAVNCETLVDSLSEVGLCLQKHGPITMLKATGVLETQRYGGGFSPGMFNKDIIKALRRHGVTLDHTYCNNGKLWKYWGWRDGEVGGMDLLHAAVRLGNRFDSIQYLLDEGISIHSRPCDLDGRSILEAALKSIPTDRVEVVMLLLDRMGAEREADPVWPRLLELSIPTYSPEDSDLQLFHHVKSLGAPLPIATDPVKASQRLSLIPKLIAAKSQNDTIAEIWNCGMGFEKLHEEDRARLLMETINSGGLSWACTLIEHGASINTMTIIGHSWMTAFQYACTCRYPRVDLWFFGYLLRHGGNSTFDASTGLTALHYAAHEGMLNLATLILEYHGDANAIWTPPRWALGARLSDDSLHRDMGKHRFECRLKRKWLQRDLTPLDVASAMGKLDMVKFLLNIGGQSAFPGLTGLDGALKLAEKKTRHGVVMLLQQEQAARSTAS
ncbi:ankyrin repeat-containing domain protein [Apiospora arundinis]|uniref:Ankyrin repeat-containing domain protein n=1 Tax=Apiospora arundinis TaxID=335852 RepID=A0ABR2IWL0_9PEZI